MVCCVYVCSSWKAAGLFGDDEVNCSEMTNLDGGWIRFILYSSIMYYMNDYVTCYILYMSDFTLNIFEEQQQIIGRWTLKLNKFNLKKPYEHMAETCPSLAPDYEQAADC